MNSVINICVSREVKRIYQLCENELPQKTLCHGIFNTINILSYHEHSFRANNFLFAEGVTQDTHLNMTKDISLKINLLDELQYELTQCYK